MDGLKEMKKKRLIVKLVSARLTRNEATGKTPDSSHKWH